jgi:hypothetical protein
MAKLYRLVQADGFCFRAFGLTIGVRVNQPAILRKLQARLPFGWSPFGWSPFGWSKLQSSGRVSQLYSLFINGDGRHTRVRRFHLLYGNAQILARCDNEDDLLAEFERQVNAHIFENCRNRCFVHAGVVAVNGKAIVLPGRTFTGKSSLVMEFLKHGATYYSDEVAVFDRRGLVHAFPKALGIRTQTDKQDAVPAGAIPSPIGIRPIPVGLVLLTRYKPSAAWRPRSASPGHGVLALLRNSLSGRANPSLSLQCLSAAVANAAVLSGRRGEASTVVRAVLEKQMLSLGPVRQTMSQSENI